MEARRVCLLSNLIRHIEIVNGQGLSRSYDSYSEMPNRCRTKNDIYVKSGQTMTISVEGYDVAVGTWNEDTKANVLYGGWNSDKSYTPTVDVLCKLVFRKKGDNLYVFTDDELKGKLTITVGNAVYKH